MIKFLFFLASPQKEPKNASPNLSRSEKIIEWTDVTKVVHC